ncbi:MAG: 3-isopropylmalate dehydrogenase [Candidatus Lambdaproteobacteria bacterium]|nr:3-isopropylmalate dehydrogenase [Candidatus Lambdaproteobacteria bacterium]
MDANILVIAGDGVGPEVTAQGLKALKVLAKRERMRLALDEAPMGGAAYDLTGSPLPDATLAKARAATAILFGAVGGPKWEKLPFAVRPEAGLLKLRRALELYANLRPAKVFDAVADASTLKREVVAGTDIMVVRELTGGLYFGEPRGIRDEGGRRIGVNTMVYDDLEIERIVRMGFKIAAGRRKRLLSVEKANALEVSQLWREVATGLAGEYPDVALTHMYVDNAAMQLVRAPRQIDTLVTENLFGDILSDEAAMLTGSIGLLPSASLGERHALYEPIHGSAPDIAGRDLANPLATILSVGMMFRYTFGKPAVDERVHRAVTGVLERYRTADIMSAGKTQVGCAEMGDLLAAALEAQP